MRKIFVSNDGNDSNSGEELTPIKTIAKAIEVARGGDWILLRRGDIFYETIRNFTVATAGTNYHITAYGHGEKPVICGFKIITGSWSNYSTGIWRINIAGGSGQYSGYMGNATNAGYLVDSYGNIHGVSRASVPALTDEWDFYSDTDFLYVKKATSPGANVKAAVGTSAIVTPNNIYISDLKITGWGAHGVQIYTSNVVVENCIIDTVGGSRLTDGRRYGNGVECWIGTNNVTIRNNTIREVYDTATTMQGLVENTNQGWRNITFENNFIEKCNQSFETWSMFGTLGESGHGFVNCKFINNTCKDAGLNWAGDIRPDLDGTGTHILTYNMQLPTDITVSGNIFYNAKDNYTRHSFGSPAGMKFNNNSIYLEEGKKIDYTLDYTIADYIDYQDDTNLENESTFFTIDDSVGISSAISSLMSSVSYSINNQNKDESSNVGNFIKDIPFDITTLSNNATVASRFTKLGSFKIGSQYGVIQALIAFQRVDNSEVSLSTSGFISLGVAGIGGGSSTVASLRVNSADTNYAATTSNTLRANNFVIVRTVNDTVNHNYEFELWVRLTDLYSRIKTRIIMVEPDGVASWQWFNGVEISTALPSGTLFEVTRPVNVVFDTVTAAPSTTPTNVGQMRVDTTNKKIYVSTGTASSSDWTILN